MKKFLSFFILFLCMMQAAQCEQEKKVVYFFPCFWGNDIFNPLVQNTTFYDLEPFYRLNETAAIKGYDLRIADGCNTQLRDVHGKDPEYPQHFDSIVVFEVTDHQIKLLEQYPSEKLTLILWEPPTTLPNNYNTANHRIFSRVYTWKDDLVDNKKYFKIFYPVLKPMSPNPIEFEKRKLAVMVAGNKKSWVENELYTEKRNLVDFFEKNHPDDFDLYGGDWPEDLKTYKKQIPGNLESKIEKLKEYKFAIAYENGKEIPGYISEKIFDCFAAGVVPVYWGAPNITSYIPQNCFIAREDFKSNEELYDYLTAMTKEQYLEYISHIQKYLNSDQAKVFSSDNFQQILLDMIARPKGPIKDNI